MGEVVIELKIEHRTVGDWTVLKLNGEVDVYTCSMLREAVNQAVADGRYLIAVDVQAVDFMDSSGLGVIVGAHKRLRGHDGSLILVSPNKQMRRILSLTGLDQILTVRQSVGEATA
ncbi:MAG TPA: STAS domain-containing protein [Actinomycetota bacterium]|nr:STAS domain-containing protein [Actinomycetota bacterium]